MQFNAQIPQKTVDKRKPLRANTLKPESVADRVIEEGSDDNDSFASDTPCARGRRG
jgi:hypothetical protein